MSEAVFIQMWKLSRKYKNAYWMVSRLAKNYDRHWKRKFKPEWMRELPVKRKPKIDKQ